MDVRAAPAVAPIIEPLMPLGNQHVAGTRREGSVGDSVHLLSTPEIRGLLDSIDTRRFSHDASTPPSVHSHDTPHALAALSEYVSRHPEHATGLMSNPAAREVVHHVTEAARAEAVRSLAGAALVVDAAIRQPPQMDGPAVLAMAERLIESGQLANYYRAADLGLAVVGAYAPVKRGPKKILRLRTLWRRAPLLVLLMGWLTLGLAGALPAILKVVSASSAEFGFELWGVGFLALVVFQFYVTTRNR